MTGPDRPREEPPADQTQMLPPGMFGRAPTPRPPAYPVDEPPLLSGRPSSDPPLYGSREDLDGSEDRTRQHAPFGTRAEPDHESTQYLPKSEPTPASTWNQPDPAPATSWSGGQPAASLPPTVAPPYAPEPPPYQPQYPGAAPAVIAPVVVPVASQQSRGAAGWVSVLLGLLLAVAGLFLFLRFGFPEDGERTVGNIAAAGLGVALLFGAALLNSWSGWATLVPGIVFAGLGGLMFFDTSGDTWSWVYDAFGWAFSDTVLIFLGGSGLLLIIGLLLLGASIAAFVARRSGRREVSPAAAGR